VVLLVAAAAPLAFAWARVLPEEPPPFEIERPASNHAEDTSVAPPGIAKRRDAFAILLLVCITLSYLLKFPGVPVAGVLQRLSASIPQDYFEWVLLGGRVFFLGIPGVAAVYAVFRPNPLRAPLITAGILVLSLWLLAPFLRAALLAAS
jgi:hypothetical protein